MIVTSLHHYVTPTPKCDKKKIPHQAKTMFFAYKITRRHVTHSAITIQSIHIALYLFLILSHCQQIQNLANQSNVSQTNDRKIKEDFKLPNGEHSIKSPS